MKSKSVFTAVLLLFVAASVVAVAVRKIRQSSPEGDRRLGVRDSGFGARGSGFGARGSGLPSHATPQFPIPNPQSPTPSPQPPVPTRTDGVIVYYLHGNYRCPTCLSIEAYAREAVETGFADQLKSGRVDWRSVNYEQPPNEHFAKDYELIAPAVVLVKTDGGRQTKWKNLTALWDLVADKEAFIDFVQKQVEDLLEGSGKEPKQEG